MRTGAATLTGLDDGERALLRRVPPSSTGGACVTSDICRTSGGRPSPHGSRCATGSESCRNGSPRRFRACRNDSRCTPVASSSSGAAPTARCCGPNTPSFRSIRRANASSRSWSGGCGRRWMPRCACRTGRAGWARRGGPWSSWRGCGRRAGTRASSAARRMPLPRRCSPNRCGVTCPFFRWSTVPRRGSRPSPGCRRRPTGTGGRSCGSCCSRARRASGGRRRGARLRTPGR